MDILQTVSDKYFYYRKTGDDSLITDHDVELAQTETSKMNLLEKIFDEIYQMKRGSYALVNQITTISKQRIYDPKNDLDILSEIKLSKEKMNLIDEKIKDFFINN